MQNDKSTVERAFELAKGGQCHSIEDIRRALSGEQYDNVRGHLAGPALGKQLRELIDAATAEEAG